MKVINNNDEEINILHFQGRSKTELSNIFELVNNNIVLDPIDKNLSLVACWTDEEQCCLYQQLKRNNIDIINAIPDNYDYNSEWDMRNKIIFYIDCLENKVNTEFVMLLDGYDVLFCSTKNIIEKFKNTGYRIIFNSTYNKYPRENIELIKNRKIKLGKFQYFNAGCCIGYKDDLIKFYKECLNNIDIPNPIKSEQKVLRYTFSNYSNDEEQKFIWLDSKRVIFHTMVGVEYNYINDTLKIIDKPKLYKKEIVLTEIQNPLFDTLLNIAIPIIKRNRNKHWEDDNFIDIMDDFNSNYITDLTYSELENMINIIIKNNETIK